MGAGALLFTGLLLTAATFAETAGFAGTAFLDADFFATTTGFLALIIFDWVAVAFLAGAGFLATDFLTLGFLATGFLVADFLTAGFLAAGFLTFFGAGLLFLAGLDFTTAFLAVDFLLLTALGAGLAGFFFDFEAIMSADLDDGKSVLINNHLPCAGQKMSMDASP